MSDGPVTAEVICGERADHCLCAGTPGHTTPHVCFCGGSWTGTFGGDDFIAITLPAGYQRSDLIGDIFGFYFGGGIVDFAGIVGDDIDPPEAIGRRTLEIGDES